jgi:hypothetical protein
MNWLVTPTRSLELTSERPGGRVIRSKPVSVGRLRPRPISHATWLYYVFSLRLRDIERSWQASR